MYVPAAQIVVLSHTQAVAPALGPLPVPHEVSGDVPPVQKKGPVGQGEHTPNNDFLPAGQFGIGRQTV